MTTIGVPPNEALRAFRNLDVLAYRCLGDRQHRRPTTSLATAGHLRALMASETEEGDALPTGCTFRITGGATVQSEPTH